MALDHGAAGRDRHLLILRGKRVAAELSLQALEHRKRLAHRRKRLAGPPVVDFRRRYRNVLVGLGDGGKIENLPLVGLACDKAGQVIHMDALHDDDDRARALVVEARQQRVLEPFIGGVALGLGIGVVGLEGIVDDDDVAASTGQCAPDRCRQPEAARGEFDLGL